MPIDFVRAVGNGDHVAGGKMDVGYVKHGGRVYLGIVPESEKEALAKWIVMEPLRLAGCFHWIGTNQGVQRSTAGVDVPRPFLLVAAEDGEVLLIPLISPLVAVVGGVIPNCAVQQRVLQGAE